jgi:hypothetical protein
MKIHTVDNLKRHLIDCRYLPRRTALTAVLILSSTALATPFMKGQIVVQ